MSGSNRHCTLNGDEQLDIGALAVRWIQDVGLLASLVDKRLLAGTVHLAHRKPPAAQPPPVELAELGVLMTVTVGVSFQILQVEQRQRHALARTLGVDQCTIGARALVLGRRRGAAQTGLEV